jgi:hypothetical protein
MVAFQSVIGSIQLYRAATDEPLATLPMVGPSRLRGIRFTPDDARLTAVNREGILHVWDLHRIRGQLREIGLDWDPPSGPPVSASSMRLDRGEARP